MQVCVLTRSIPCTRSGQQYELLDWLEHVTFPMESRFSDPDFARRAYTSVIKRTIDYGVSISVAR